MKIARCLGNNPLGPAGRRHLVIGTDGKKKHLKDEELAQERVQENTQCGGGNGQTINYVDEKGLKEHILEGASV